MIDLFPIPLATGAAITSALALIGCGMLLARSVWQALALSQWAAVGGVVASITGGPAFVVSAALAAIAGGITRSTDARWPLAVFVVGLATIPLLAINAPSASLAAARWIDGQVLFVGPADLAIAGVTTLAVWVLWPWMERVWLHCQIAPDIATGAGPPNHAHVIDAIVVVVIVVLGTVSLGVPATLATLLFPTWAAAWVASDLRRFVLWAQVLALLGFATAWGISLGLDQPVGPVLVLTDMAVAGVAVLASRRRPLGQAT